MASSFTRPEPNRTCMGFIKDAVTKRPTCRNADHLFETLNELWEEISPQYLRSLTHSMRCRITAVIDSDGGHTKY